MGVLAPAKERYTVMLEEILDRSLFLTSRCCYLTSVKKMTDCQGEGGKSPMELYEKLNAQGDQVRSLKAAKAEKVSDFISQFEISHTFPLSVSISL